MSEFQTIRINGQTYEIIDSIQNLRIEDSFANNKQTQFTGHGETRKYVGTYVENKGKRLSNFFEYHRWGSAKTKNDGKRYEYPIIQENCFFSKSNLMRYMYDAKYGYESPWIYRSPIGLSDYFNNQNLINSIKMEVIPFSIYDVSDLLHHHQNRAYIRSNDEVWDIFRTIILPHISYLSILKLRAKNSQTISFYFRIFIDDEFREIKHPFGTTEILSHLYQLNKIKITKRLHQASYRKNVINYMKQCPFTLITDQELLIASHIKPYVVCMKEGFENEAFDYLNGLSLTPTYDKLFDRGFITFTDNGELVCCAQLYPESWEKLGIKPNEKRQFQIYPQGREKYLEYHRQFVFQDNIDDFL